MRISQSMLFDNFVKYLNNSTSKLQELTEQASTQKKVNRPSDDPVGMSRILGYRDSISALEQYQNNINTAKGWLGLADDTLNEAQDILSRVKELAVQAANGSLTSEDRRMISEEIKNSFDQLLKLSNTTYEGKSIFAGHRTDTQAFTKGLAVYSNESRTVARLSGTEYAGDKVTPYVEKVYGQSDDPVIIEFIRSESGGDSATLGDPDETIYYRYSTNGGKTYLDGRLKNGETSFDFGGVSLELRSGYEVNFASAGKLQENTKVYLAPTGIYQGDNLNSSAVEMHSNLNYTVETLQGSFDSDVRVKVFEPVDLGDEYMIEYQYSLDNGGNWSDRLQAYVPDPATGESIDSIILDLPGGKVEIDTPSDAAPAFGGLSDGAVSFGSVSDPSLAPTGLSGSGVSDAPISPASISFGGISDAALEFSIHGTEVTQSNTNVHAFAQGAFENQVLVRIEDSDPTTADTMESIELGNAGTGETIYYSYSLDAGNTWIKGNRAENPTAGEYAELQIPGGKLNIAAKNANLDELEPGDQFVIHPREASVNTEISQGVDLAMNTVGTDIFGGHYQNAGGQEPAFEEDQGKNMFMTLGKLITALDTNNQEEIQNSLEAIDSSINQVASMQADIGSRENRLEISEKVLSDLQLNEQERKGFIEDVDFAELMSQLSQQQTIYQAVLKSSSMIMQMSLINYI